MSGYNLNITNELIDEYISSVILSVIMTCYFYFFSFFIFNYNSLGIHVYIGE
jgi:hypothetical protein